MNQLTMLSELNGLSELKGLKKAIRSPTFSIIISKAFILTGFPLFWRSSTLFALTLLLPE